MRFYKHGHLIVFFLPSCGEYLVIWFGVVIQGQNVVQEDTKF